MPHCAQTRQTSSSTHPHVVPSQLITSDKEITPSLKSRLSKIKHLALDMDGTIYLGSTLFPFTLDFLASMKENGVRYSFLTNNPTKSVGDYLKKL